MFQLKNFVSIAASMLNYVRSTTGKVTDLQPGSVTRTILEAPAAEIEELYVQVFNGIKEAIPVAVYNSIKFDKLPAQYASGRVTIIATKPLTQNLTIPQGTQFLSRDGRIYESVADMLWPSTEATFTIPVRSRATGQGQNLAAGEINTSSFFDQDSFTFSNTDMVNGSDVESDDARDIRFADYIASLSRGTETAMMYGAKTATLVDAAGNITEAVDRVSLTVSTGTVRVNIWGTNGMPSPALISRVSAIELGSRDVVTGVTTPGYAAAGISCQVGAMMTQTVNVDYRIVMLPGYTFTGNEAAYTQRIKDSLDSFLSTVQPGTTVYVNDLQNMALLVVGIKSASVSITGNIVVPQNVVLVAGTVGVTEQ